MKFKVDDEITVLKVTSACVSDYVGKSVKIINIIYDNSIVNTHELYFSNKDHEYLIYNVDEFVLTSIYNSPLYKAMNE
jgi:hypothetical protein